MFTVRRLRDPRADVCAVPDAADHRDAVARSRLAAPGADLIVSDGHTVIRYRIDRIGRIVEQSRYTA